MHSHRKDCKMGLMGSFGSFACFTRHKKQRCWTTNQLHSSTSRTSSQLLTTFCYNNSTGFVLDRVVKKKTRDSERDPSHRRSTDQSNHSSSFIVMVLEQDFPRGRGGGGPPSVSSTHHHIHRSEEHANTKKQPTSESSSERKRRHRAGKDSASAAAATDATIKTDFLFGTSRSDTQQRVSKRRRGTTREKERGGGAAAAAAAAANAVVAPSTSMLPVGGGGCSAPRASRNSNSSSSNSNSNSNILIEPLSFNKLRPGFKMLAIVKEVHEDLAIFSLPNLWTAYALRDRKQQHQQQQQQQQQPPPLDQQLRVRQVVTVAVVRAVSESVPGGGGGSSSRRRIQVSVAPGQCNPVALPVNCIVGGRVRSVEDHGVLVDLGLQRRGFLPFEQIEGEYTTTTTEEDDEMGDDDSDSDNKNSTSKDNNNNNNSNQKHILAVHRLLNFVVREDPNQTTAAVIPLKLPSPSNLARLPLDYQPTLAELQPGMLLPSVTVEHTVRNGLAVRFGAFRGAMELTHLGAYWVPMPPETATGGSKHGQQHNHNHPDAAWKAFFDQHRQFPARILVVDPVQKIIRLTRQSHLMHLQAPRDEELPAAGTVVEGCTVLRLDPGVGALLALPEETAQNDDHDDENDDGDQPQEMKLDKHEKSLFQPLSNNKSYTQATGVKAVYVHISKALDPPTTTSRKGKGNMDGEDNKVSEALFAKQFAPGSKSHTVRILSAANWIEGIASGATAPSIVKAHVLTHADLVPGRVYKQVPVCTQLPNGSVLVDFGMGIRGLIPSEHLFDQIESSSSSAADNNSSQFRNQMRKVKYGIGAKVDVRVLSVDAGTKKCTLTAKKTLVKAPDDEIVTSYDDLALGQAAVGFVSRVDGEGLFVTLFNGVFGRVTSRSLAIELGVERHQENYSRGDAVRCRVVNLKKKKKRPSSRRGTSHYLDNDDPETEDDDENHHRHYHYELTLSLKMDGELMDTSLDDNTPRTKIQLRAGAILPLKSLRVKELAHGKEAKSSNSNNGSSFVPGYAIVAIKSKYMVGEAEAATMPPFIECKLPYDQLLDDYDADDLQSAAALDKVAEALLTVGRKINRKGLVLVDPKKSNMEYSSGTGTLAVVSVRPRLIETVEAQEQQKRDGDDGKQHDDNAVTLPGPDAHLYAGQKVLGYVAQKDGRHGAFVRFLDGMTGLVPKRSGGLHLPLYSTVVVQIRAVDDMVRPRKILLGLIKNSSTPAKQESVVVETGEDVGPPPFKVGDSIPEARVGKFDFHRANLKILDDARSEDQNIHLCLHCSMAQSKALTQIGKLSKGSSEQVIRPGHPFYEWKKGDKITKLQVLSVSRKRNAWTVEVTNRTSEEKGIDRVFVEKSHELFPGDRVSGIISAVSTNNSGLWLEVSPTVSARVPGLELSQDVNVLNNLAKHFPVGCRLECVVLDKSVWEEKHSQIYNHRSNEETKEPKTAGAPILSLLALSEKSTEPPKPGPGDLIVGRIDRSIPSVNPPDLMLQLRGGYIGRCCITELEEVDDWTNFPLGRGRHLKHSKETKERMDIDGEDGGAHSEDHKDEADAAGVPKEDVPFAHGMFVQCRVLEEIPSKPLLEVSLRPSRVDGDCDGDEAPEAGETARAYVVATSKKGCFLRLGRQTEGRVILKELCDGFLPNPAASFPMGRLVVGLVKNIQQSKNQSKGFNLAADLDCRESILIDEVEGRVKYDSIEIGDKFEGTVTRIEDYGVFVRIENSEVSGLVHKSECSDKFIKNLAELYDPGDLVKLIVIKKNKEKKQLGFSMKASHFEGDENMDDESSTGSDDVSMDGSEANEDDFGLDSDDENFAAELAEKMGETVDSDEGSDDDEDQDVESDRDAMNAESNDKHVADAGDSSGSSSESSSDSSDESEEEKDEKLNVALDTNVGFDWNAGLASSKPTNEVSDEDSDSSENEEDGDATQKESHKSRKKQASRRREEEEIARREAALADGTADQNPETAADFERLIAGDPNSSELWIKYMAFHLTLANIPAAREIANRAFSRIEFRREKEKLNVWCALLTLELKYGSEESLQETLARACQHNNPKYVYLRMCEMLEKQGSSPDALRKTDDMFAKMCKKFKDKKKVWIAHMEYMLKNGRHEEAFALSKRALLSLKPYKHVETMSKFAQLVFEFGSAEKARTIFDGLLLMHPKRLDQFFVYADKEVKYGDINVARSLYARVASPDDETLTLKLSDRQMKRFFKKWFSFEEMYGTEETQERVKDAARAFVERSMS